MLLSVKYRDVFDLFKSQAPHVCECICVHGYVYGMIINYSYPCMSLSVHKSLHGIVGLRVKIELLSLMSSTSQRTTHHDKTTGDKNQYDKL